MEAKAMNMEKVTLQPLMRLELFLASLLPVAAILLIGVVGTRWIMPAYLVPFIIVFLLCALAVFFGEYALISSLQDAMKGQFSDLIAVCLDYQAGNKQRRARLQGSQDLTTALAQALNSLLEFISRQQVSPQEAVEKGQQPLAQRLKQLAHEVAPVMDADLRQKATIADGDIGIVIDACNYLIEGFVQQIKWARHGSEQVITATREMVDRSIEFAQNTETQMKRLSRTIETGEKLVAFIQRLGNILQLSVDLALEMQTPQDVGDTDKHPRYPMIVDSTPPANNASHRRSGRFNADTQQQVQLLEEALRALQEHTVLAETMIGDLYAFAQRMDHSSSAVLNTAERIGSLASLAERWRSSVATFYLPGDALQNASSVNMSEVETIRYPYPSQAAPTQRA